MAGLFILGPERLPSAAAWVGRSVRQVREYASGAREQLRGELGPEFDELRKPLEELRSLRDLEPAHRRASAPCSTTRPTAEAQRPQPRTRANDARPAPGSREPLRPQRAPAHRPRRHLTSSLAPVITDSVRRPTAVLTQRCMAGRPGTLAVARNRVVSGGRG